MKGRPYCCYCKRTLNPERPITSLSFTLDHVIPKHMGGLRTVPCCRACNQLKGDIEPNEWFWFIRTRAGWWRDYRHTGQVRDVIREERVRRARLNAARQRGEDAR